MPTRPIALTCIADVRLRLTCAILLRHAGYRVIEAVAVSDAVKVLDGTDVVAVTVSGVLADPVHELAEACARHGVRCVEVGPQLPTETLLSILGLPANTMTGLPSTPPDGVE